MISPGRTDMYPHLTHFEENRRAVERDGRLRQEIRARRAAQRAARPSRFDALAHWLSRAPQPNARPGCATC